MSRVRSQLIHSYGNRIRNASVGRQNRANPQERLEIGKIFRVSSQWSKIVSGRIIYSWHRHIGNFKLRCYRGIIGKVHQKWDCINIHIGTVCNG